MSGPTFFGRPPRVPDETIDELEVLLRRKFDLKTGFAEKHKLAQALEAVFKGFDLLQQGNRITKEAFLTAMQRLNCADNLEVVRSLFDRHDHDDKGYLTVQDFASGLFGLKPVPQSAPACRDAVRTVKQRILARGGKNGVRTLSRILRLMDDNGNRRLDKEELRTGLADYGVELTKDELDTVFYFFDRDRDGSVSVTELLVGIRGKMSPPRVAIVRQAYVRLDKNDDRRVDMQDLKMAYRTEQHPEVLSGAMTPEEVLREFAAGWDKNGDDLITEEEFLDYYKDLSAGIDSDEYFELMIRNAWHLAGGKGLAANTTNRRVMVTHLDGTQTVETVIDDLGLGSDPERVKDALRKQGINDILRISLN